MPSTNECTHSISQKVNNTIEEESELRLRDSQDFQMAVDYLQDSSRHMKKMIAANNGSQMELSTSKNFQNKRDSLPIINSTSR